MKFDAKEAAKLPFDTGIIFCDFALDG